MNQALTIHHDLADVVLKPTSNVDTARLRKVIQSALDQYQEEERIPASIIHAEIQQRHGENYLTQGYYLRLFRLRAELTQVQLAKKLDMRQHHISEMENNKRTIGKSVAKKLAATLKCDYHRFL